jgi:DNA-binding GntR family transcriptional regulator
MYDVITRGETRTAADKAYETIGSKILNGELEPGQKLTRRAMADLTGVSVIPVIEALHRLEAEGLVVSHPYWGSRVITLDRETIRDRYALREAVECEVVRILSQHLSDEQRNRLEFSAKELDNTQRDPDIDNNYRNRHYRFHMLMAECTGCSSLIQALHKVGIFTLLERALKTRMGRAPVTDIPADLHQRIVQGILSGDTETAANAMRDHIYDSGILDRAELWE